jgi:cysteinyl-tRNA synthetase
LKTAAFLGFANLHNPGFFHTSFSANIYESGPQLIEGSQEWRLIVQFRAASANNLPAEIAQSRDSLDQSGFQVRLNEAGVLQVSNKTSADQEGDLKARIDKLVSARESARAAKNWVESDRLRDELAKMGIAIKDNKNRATTWEFKR